SRRETLLWDKYDLSSPKVTALVDLLAKKKIFIRPRFTAALGCVSSVGGQTPPDLYRVPRDLREMSAKGFPKRLQFIGMCYRAGVRIVTGTDGAGLGTMLPGFGLQHELVLLSQAGLPPIAVLRAATITAAESLGHEK